MKTAIFILSLVSLTLIISPVFAEETGETIQPSNTLMETRKRPLDTPSRMKTESNVDSIQRVTKVVENQSEALANECARVSTNASKLIVKIQERIDRAKIEARNMQKAQDALNAAKTDLASAKTFCEQAIAKLNSIPAGSKKSSATEFADARKLARQAREKFVSMRKNMGLALQSIRGLGIRQAAKASPPPTTNTQ